ncbi:MAG: MBOAT family protein, partial [Clostridia bacterium]|nr:MBOAT family protein [Clostridia bacterium]
MVFSSLTFLLLFLPIVTGLYFAKNNLNWRNTVLVVASVLFYAWGEPVWVLGMIVSTLINYVCAIAIVRSRSSLMRKLSLTLGVIASVALLFYFKYAAFLFNSVSGLFGAGAVLPVLELPIGISFYTFQILTYSVDVYRGKAQYQKNPAWLLLYVSCFPQ